MSIKIGAEMNIDGKALEVFALNSTTQGCKLLLLPLNDLLKF